MKNIFRYGSLVSLLAAATIFASCTKENSDVKFSDSKLTTSETINITSNSATVVGFIVSTGSGITEKGVCYNTATAPTVNDNKVVYTADSVTATFNVTLTGLNFATKYYARAYAVTSAGVVYGAEVTFTTLPILATVTTSTFTANTGTTANGGGEVTADGGATVTKRGVCYSVNPNPTIAHADSTTSDGDGLGTFTSALSHLQGLTTYHVRAYATNSAGTAYGEDVEFTTPAAIVTLYAVGAFQGWDPANASDSLMNTDADPIVRGYVYLTAGEYKFVAQKSWTGTAYGAGSTAGTLSTDAGAGNLSVASDGYYMFALDLNLMTYTATKTTWGVIGDATAGGWSSDQSMTYSPAFKQWVATIPLTVGSFKFRANADWTINYGDGGDGLLAYNGSNNISQATAGTYSVMMNLSSPVSQSYTVTEWSITGDAVGGWGVDTDMTPAADNTWTVTATFTAGDFKFRANHDWAISLGGTPSKLDFGGANITITTPGTYTVTLDLVNGTYTLN